MPCLYQCYSCSWGQVWLYLNAPGEKPRSLQLAASLDDDDEILRHILRWSCCLGNGAASKCNHICRHIVTDFPFGVRWPLIFTVSCEQEAWLVLSWKAPRGFILHGSHRWSNLGTMSWLQVAASQVVCYTSSELMLKYFIRGFFKAIICFCLNFFTSQPKKLMDAIKRGDIFLCSDHRFIVMVFTFRICGQDKYMYT